MDEAIATVVERELGAPPESVTRLTDGLIHETYAVECAGEAYVLQFSGTGGVVPGADAKDPDAEAKRAGAAAKNSDASHALERGVGWYRDLADAAVPVPEVVSDGVREYEGHEYVLVERVAGTSGERDVSPARIERAGEHLARLHEHRRFDAAGPTRFEDGRVRVGTFPAGSLEARIRNRAVESAATWSDFDEDAVADALDATLAADDPLVPEEYDPVLCHGDYSADNVLFDGERVAGVVDFDRAYAGYAGWDLAWAATGFWMHDPGADWAPRERFYEGYRSVRDPGEAFARREPAYRVLTLSTTVASMLRAGHFSEYEREFYAEALLEAVERIENG